VVLGLGSIVMNAGGLKVYVVVIWGASVILRGWWLFLDVLLVCVGSLG